MCVLCHRIDPHRFLAGCRRRRLNQGLVVASYFTLIVRQGMLLCYFVPFLGAWSAPSPSDATAAPSTNITAYLPILMVVALMNCGRMLQVRCAACPGSNRVATATDNDDHYRCCTPSTATSSSPTDSRAGPRPAGPREPTSTPCGVLGRP